MDRRDGAPPGLSAEDRGGSAPRRSLPRGGSAPRRSLPRGGSAPRGSRTPARRVRCGGCGSPADPSAGEVTDPCGQSAAAQ
ncbi:MAG: hypothetical protein B7X32_17390, partial [Microbacterium sp. 13-71-7]